MTTICFKCGADKNIIRHHISYNPENIVMCCVSCHRKIHIKVRKNNSCPLSVKETNKISARLCTRNLHKTNRRMEIRFTETILPYVQIFERVSYSFNSGKPTCTTHFQASGNKQLKFIGEK